MDTHAKLVHAVTEYDRKQSTRRGHNIYALPQYLARIEDIDTDLANGADIRSALTSAFSGRLLDACLKAMGLNTSTNAEQRGGIFYVPASNK